MIVLPIPSTSTVIANTDAQGRAQVSWTLGERAGAGGNTLEAYSVGYNGTAIFTATGIQGQPGRIVIDSGNSQIGAVGQTLSKPLIAVVVDAGNNRLANVPANQAKLDPPVRWSFAGRGGGAQRTALLTYLANSTDFITRHKREEEGSAGGGSGKSRGA